MSSVKISAFIHIFRFVEQGQCRILECVSSAYFENLNYTLANEDSRFESHILPEGLDHVVTVGGSGARVIPLLAKKPKRISVLDISQAQLALCELRIQSLREFNHEQYLRFWGYPSSYERPVRDREVLFHELRLTSENKR